MAFSDEESIDEKESGEKRNEKEKKQAIKQEEKKESEIVCGRFFFYLVH